MREIKFRAWHAGHKHTAPQMLYDEKPGDCLVWQSQGQNITQVMQYTGLKDKNGREIYEGDIVLEDYFSNVNPNDHSDDEYIDDTPRKFIICYDSNQGRYKAVPPETYRINAGNGGWTGYDVRGYKAEVIGNIYENPELLEV